MGSCAVARARYSCVPAIPELHQQEGWHHRCSAHHSNSSRSPVLSLTAAVAPNHIQPVTVVASVMARRSRRRVRRAYQLSVRRGDPREGVGWEVLLQDGVVVFADNVHLAVTLFGSTADTIFQILGIQLGVLMMTALRNEEG